jgi:cell division protein FtsW (lipid II flippase)
MKSCIYKSTAAGTIRREAMMALIVYAGIFILSIYVAVVSQGYIMALALVVGGIAFFAIQRHLHKYYSEIVTKDEMDSDSDDDDDHLRLPPA